MPFYNWSQTAGSNASADATINWAEGQAPSTINDSARAMMAALAKYRDDITGSVATGGTSTAYTVTSNSTFDTLAHLANQIIAFTPHTTNGATVTLNVDGLGAKPLRSAPSTELLAGVLIQGTPYIAIYNNSDGAFYLQSFYGNPYNVPLASGMDYWGSSAPNSSFAFGYGQAISRTTYSTLFAIMGTTYGTGDGSTTFNIPDMRGRVAAGKDDMGGSAASRLTTATMSGSGLGATSSATETKTLSTANLPPYTPSGSVSQTGATTAGTGGATGGLVGGGTVFVTGSGTVSASFTGTAQGGTSTAFSIVQPTIICNYIIRVL